MNIIENIKPLITGELFFQAYKDDKFLYEFKKSNLVVTNSKLILAGLIASDFNDYRISQFGIGDGIVAPALNQQALQGSNYKILNLNLSENTIVGSQQATIAWSINYNTDIYNQNMGATNPWTGPYQIQEMALFSNNGTMFNRIILNSIQAILDKNIRFSGYFTITVN